MLPWVQLLPEQTEEALRKHILFPVVSWFGPHDINEMIHHKHSEHHANTHQNQRGLRFYWYESHY